MNRLLGAVPFACTVAPFVALAITGRAAFGHDFPFELTRIAAYAHAWADGQWPPYWAGDLYAGYGSAVFLMYGQVFLALSGLWSAVTGSYVVGSNLALAAVTAFGVWSMQLAAAELAERDETRHAAGRIAACVFLLNPYVLGDAVLRNAYAEYTALCAAPLAVAGLIRCARGRRGPWTLAAGLALVFSAHVLSAGFVCGVLLVLALALLPSAAERRAYAASLAAGLGLALSLSAFFWLPVLAYAGEMRTRDLLTGKFDVLRNFVAWSEIFGTSTFHGAGLWPIVTVVVAMLVAVPAQRRIRAEQPHLRARTARLWAGLIATIVGCAWLQTSSSAWLWELVPPARYVQFPWRLTGPLMLAAALLTAVVFDRAAGASKRTSAIGEAAIVCFCLWGAAAPLSSTLLIKHVDVASFERGLRRESLSAHARAVTVGNEYVPTIANPELAKLPATTRPVLTNDATARVTLSVDEPRRLAFEIELAREQAICVARWAFSFWELRLDGRQAPQTKSKLGCLALRVPSGKHQVEAVLQMPWPRRVGLALSLSVLCLLVIASLRRRARTH